MNYLKSYYQLNEDIDNFLSDDQESELKNNFNISIDDLEDYLLCFSDVFYVRVIPDNDKIHVSIHYHGDISKDINTLRNRLGNHNLVMDESYQEPHKVMNGKLVLTKLLVLKIYKK